MITYVLIDTCNLRRLISKNEIGHQLKRLTHWVENQHVRLLVPEGLITEWEKHREKERDAIKHSIKKHADVVKANKLMINVDRPILTTVAQKLLETQIEMVDRLLAEGQQVKVSPAVLQIVYQLAQSKQPPFRTKFDSRPDAYCIFSTMEYCVIHSIDELYFISDNYTDFADQNFDIYIHPTIQEKFPDCNVKYFRNLDSCFSQLEEVGLPILTSPKSAAHAVHQIWKVDIAAPIIDQVYEYLQLAFKEWNFLPRQILHDQYPFLIGDKPQFNKHPFTLHTDNTQITGLLTGVKIENDKYVHTDMDLLEGVREPEKKLKTIIATLSRNLIRSVANNDSREGTEILNLSMINLPTATGKFERFEFQDLFDLDAAVQDSTEKILEVAAVQFRMGHIDEAAQSLLLAVTKATEYSENALYFIAQYNLSILKIMLHSYYYPDQQPVTNMKELEDIDVSTIFNYCKNSENESLLKRIIDEDFLTEFNFQIHQLVGKIRVDYHTRNTGHNGYTKELLFQYMEFNGFIFYNHLFAEIYDHFQQTSNVFIEGLLASYACQDELGGKLRYFHDQLLFIMVRYGKYENIREYIDRYGITIITYEQTEKRKGFVDIFLGFLRTYDQVTTANKACKNIPTKVFWHNYNHYFHNFLLLTSYLNLSADQDSLIADHLLTFLKKEQHLRFHPLLQVLGIFIKKKGKHLSVDLLLSYLELCILYPKFRDDYLTHNICEELKEKIGFPFDISSDTFSVFRQAFLPVPHTSDISDNIGIIERVYNSITDQGKKNEISQYITQILESSFRPYLFYKATMSGIIASSDTMTAKYHTAMANYISSLDKSQSHHYEHFNFSDEMIDSYMNFVLMENYTLPEPVQSDLLEMGPYYRWLLNIDIFDYSKFNYKWLSRYFTIYYKTRFMQSTVLKRHLLEYIRQNPKSPAQGVFIRVFNIDD